MERFIKILKYFSLCPKTYVVNFQNIVTFDKNFAQFYKTGGHLQNGRSPVLKGEMDKLVILNLFCVAAQKWNLKNFAAHSTWKFSLDAHLQGFSRLFSRKMTFLHTHVKVFKISRHTWKTLRHTSVPRHIGWESLS